MQELWTVLTVPRDRGTLRRELKAFAGRFSLRPCETDLVPGDLRPFLREVLEFASRYFLRRGIICTLRAFMNKADKPSLVLSQDEA